MDTGISTIDEFSALPRTEIAVLDVSDVVYVSQRQMVIVNRPPEGEWAEIMELLYDDEYTVSGYVLRYWGDSNEATFVLASERFESRVAWVQVHSCECGATGPNSWRICHPEA